jgi:PEP-CTERM motif
MSLVSQSTPRQRKLCVAALSLTAMAHATAATSWSVDTAGTTPMSGYTTLVTLDSALSGLALSNGAANPFKAPAFARGPEGFIQMLNASKATVVGDSLGTVSTAEHLYGGRVQVLLRDTIVLQPQQTTIDLDASTGKLLSASLSGSYTITAPLVPGAVDGGSATLSDLQIDFTKGVITGDLLGNAGTSFEVKSNDMVMFRVGQFSGITGIDFSAASAAISGDSTLLSQQGWTLAPPVPGAFNAIAMSGWLELQDLQATDQFMLQFADSLGAVEGGTVYNGLASLNNSITSWLNPGHGWGTLRLGLGVRVNNISLNAPSTVLAPVTLNASQLLQPVTAAVPEPSAVALMLVGLVGIGAAARRKHRHSHTN